MPRASRREHLVDIAISLFGEHGFHATGIDLLLQEAGVSKKTMYRYFRSKEELIYAALKKKDGIFRNEFMKAVEASGITPKEKLMAIFDVAEKWFREDSFFGCMFVSAIAEYSSDDSPIREICKQFKKQMWDYIYNLAVQSGAENPKELADELALLLDGATSIAQVSQKPQAAKTASKIARVLIEES
ncbi:MAG: TetR/AcrR family transcriptional regulator [Calditrichia bacterium]